MKFLLMTLDNHLKRGTQIDYIVTKMGRFSFLFQTIYTKIDEQVAIMVYYYLYSQIKYVVIFWRNNTRITCIFILQKSYTNITQEKKKTTTKAEFNTYPEECHLLNYQSS